MGSKSSGQTQLVEKFGGYWPEESIYTEEYITNDTVDVYLDRHKNEIISGNKKDRWQMRWLHYIWNGVQAYVEFWHRTGNKLAIHPPVPDNLIIPPHDYNTGNKIISISDRKEVSSVGEFYLDLYLNYILDTESRFTGLKHMADWELIFTATLEAMKVKRGIPILNVLKNDVSKKEYDKKIQRIKNKTKGKLIIKEYPTAAAHVGHFRHLLQELNIKKDFRPDIIFIDYLNICASHRIRPGSGANSYSLVKSIAEELGGLAVEYDVPMVSATQTTRSGYGSTDIGLEDTSESFGLPATADLMFALITSDELEDLDQLVVKQLKNRYNDPTIFKRFVIGVDRSRMKLYDVEQEAQEELIDSVDVDDDTPVFDRSEKFRDFKV